jgi:valyl-tRNA synthetase
MRQVMEVITRIRNIRGEMNIAPSLKLKAALVAADAEMMRTLENGRNSIMNLANLETLTISREMAEPKGAATAVAGSVRVYVFLAGVIDVAGEGARLAKEIARIDKELALVSKKLANPAFIAKAAEAVVKKEQAKARELEEKRTALEAALARLQAFAEA